MLDHFHVPVFLVILPRFVAARHRAPVAPVVCASRLHIDVSRHSSRQVLVRSGEVIHAHVRTLTLTPPLTLTPTPRNPDQVYYPAFEACVRAGAAAVMCGCARHQRRSSNAGLSRAAE